LTGFTFRMRFLVSLMAGLVLAGAAPVVAASAARSASGAASVAATAQSAPAEFGAGPASATKLDGRPYFTYDASPGGSLEDHIAIVNFSTKPLKLNVYTVDASSGPNGDFVYATESAARKQVGSWLSIGTKTALQITVPARTTLIEPFRLKVPANAGPGDHAGAVIVSINGLVRGKNQKLRLEQRIATRVIVRVSGALHPRLSIQNLHASYSGSLNPFASGVVTVTYTVRNTGNALLGATQQVSVHGLFGTSRHSAALKSVPFLLPGGSYQVKTRVPGVLPEIWVTASVRLGPQGLRGDINQGIHVSTASVTVLTMPWVLLVLVIALLAYIILRNWRRLVRSPKPDRANVKKTPQGVKS
jgi:WxL Interacting Protein, peptidoglycan binding domain